MSPKKLILSPVELKRLKRLFTERWPDAAKSIQIGSKHVLHVEASCLWLGFKEGFLLGRDIGSFEEWAKKL